VGNRSGCAYDLSNLGKAYEDLGDFKQSAAYQERALALWRELGQRRALIFGLILLIHAALGRGDRARAREAFEEVRSLTEEYASDNDLLCHLAQGAAALALEENDLSQASLEIETGFLLAETLGFKIYLASLHFHRARLKERQGDWPGAQSDYEDSASLYGSLGEKARLARSFFFYARALLAHGEKEKGRWYLTEARRLFEAIGAKDWLERMESEGP
jgi:tetratricopeptide (TPR) repeat protein